MIIQQQYFRIKPFEFDLFCGMDVDKKSISITFVSHEGFVKSLKIPYDSTNLIHYVRRNFPHKRLAFVYEAGPTGFGLHDDLINHGYFCLVVAPIHISRSPAERVKTNRIDSRKLAEKLRGADLYRNPRTKSPLSRSQAPGAPARSLGATSASNKTSNQDAFVARRNSISSDDTETTLVNSGNKSSVVYGRRS